MGALPARGAIAGESAMETVAAFSTERSVWWLVRDGELVESGPRRDFRSSTEGAVATAEGRIVEIYGVLPDPTGSSGTGFRGGIDVLSAEGALERRWLFAGRSFDGVAVDEEGRLWVSDAAVEELLEIDLDDGSILRHLPLQTKERLQDIDADGYFYLLAPGGTGWAIRIRTPDGAYVRDISLGNHTVIPWTRVDADGRLVALALSGTADSGRLFTLLPDGQVLDAIEVPVNSLSFGLTTRGSGWFGFRRYPGEARLKELARDGRVLEEIGLPVGDESGAFDFVDYVAVLPRAARGAACDAQRCPAAEPRATVGYPPGTVVALDGQYGTRGIVRDGDLVGLEARGVSFDSITTSGLIATPEGATVEIYDAHIPEEGRERPYATFKGIDVRGPEGLLKRWLFQRPGLNGLAIDESGRLWVSSDRELLQVDLTTGLKQLRIPLSNLQPEFLQDIDGNGYLYLRVALGLGQGWAIRIRSPEGAHVRDIVMEDSQSLLPVRIDSDGHLLTPIGLPGLAVLRPDGQRLHDIPIRWGAGLSLTREGTIWFGRARDDDSRKGLLEINVEGTVLQEVVWGDREEQLVGYVAAIPGGQRGSSCDEERCPAATPTIMPTPTASEVPTATASVVTTETPTTATPTPPPTATETGATATEGPLSPSATVTVTATAAAPTSSGCNAGAGKRRSGQVLPMLLILLYASVRRRYRWRQQSSSRENRLRPARVGPSRLRCGVAAVILTASLLAYALRADAADRYVDCCAGGSDPLCSASDTNNSGASREQAWRTIKRAADTAISGDVVRVFNGPCIEKNISFNRAALSGPGDCTAGDVFCTVFRGESVSVESPDDCLDGCPDGFLISGGVDSIKFEGFRFRESGSRRFGEPIKVFGGGNENLVFLDISVVGAHRNAGVTISNNASGALTKKLVLEKVTVDGVLGNGFKVEGGGGDSGSTLPANISWLRIVNSISVNNKPIREGVRACSTGQRLCEGGSKHGMSCQSGGCPGGTCMPAASDGLVMPGGTTHVNRTTDVRLLNFISGNNGDDGIDISNNFRNDDDALNSNYIVDSVIYKNCKAGIRTWQSLQIENTHIYDNQQSGIAVAKHDNDESVANVTIVGATLVGNGSAQIEMGARKTNLNGRIYNTVVAQAGPAAIALQYNRTGPNFNLTWDYNHFWRSQPGNVVRALVDDQAPVQCSHADIPTCDQLFTGAHANSITVDEFGAHHPPIFENGTEGQHNRHLRSDSLSWDSGVDPTDEGIATLRAHAFDRDRHPRPRDGGYDMGAFEGSLLPIPAPAGCVGDCDGDGAVDIGDLQVMLNIFFGIAPVSTCPLGDADQDGWIDIGELQMGLLTFFQSPDACDDWSAILDPIGGGGWLGGDAMLAGGGGAGGVVWFDVETVTALPGGTAVVPISITGLPVLATGVQVDLGFDPSVVASMECRAHPRLLGRTFGYSFPGEPDLPPDREAIRLAVYDPNAQASIADGPVFLCEFAILGAAGSGSYELFPHRTAVSDVTGWKLPHEVSGGAIIIAADALELLRPIGAVGGGLQEGEFKVRVASPPGSSKTITIESKTPSLCVVGTSRTGSGLVSIARSIGASATESTPFYVKGVLGAEGTCKLEMRNSSYTTSTGFVDIVRPAIRIYGLPTSVEYTAPNVPFAILIGLGNEANTDLAHLQETRPGQTFTINVHSSTPQAGVLVSPASGTFQASVIIDIKPLSSQSESGLQFDPISFGMTTTVSAESAQVTSTAAASVVVSVTQTPPGTPGPGGGC